MIEPISICGILYAGLGKVLWDTSVKVGGMALGGLVGNRVDAVVLKVGRSLHGRLLARRGLSENHDIAKGLRRAQLTATGFVLESYARRPTENPHVAFLAGVRDGLAKAEKAVETLAWNDEVEAAMFASYQQAFREPQDSDDPDVDMARLAEQTTQAAWDEMMVWAGGAHAPEMLQARFFGRMSHIVGFHDAWCAEVAEVMKSDSRFRDIFVADKLVEIGDVVISGQAMLARLEADTAGIREQIADLRDWLAGQFNDQHERHDQTQAMLKKLLDRAEADGRPLGADATQAVATTLDEVAASREDDLAEAREALDDQDPIALIDGLEAAAVSDALVRLRQAASIAYAIDVQRALRIYAKVAALDPTDVWTHIFLSRLYRAAGNLTAARASAEAALAAATEPRDNSCAIDELGSIARAEGDLAGARRAYEAGLTIAQDLSGRDPGNTAWLRDLSVSQEKLGDIARAEGDLAGARRAYEAGLVIRQDLSGRDPGNTEWLRDLSVSHDRLGDIAVAEGDLAGARRAHEAGLAIAQDLSGRDPGNTAWLRDRAVSNAKLAQVAEALGDRAGGRAGFLEAERQFRAILDISPTHAETRRMAELAASEAARLADGDE